MAPRTRRRGALQNPAPAIKHKLRHAQWLATRARDVNFVWNYCNELQRQMLRRERRCLLRRQPGRDGAALRGYTINPAYASREEAIKGSITAGKLADVIVLTKNIRKLPAREIPTTKVHYTIFNGRVIYSANGGEP
jgi:cytosine/adenosine deaminase-related metal-dependent hydrolase